MPKLRAIMALGRVAHESTLKALGLRAAAAPFAHGAIHQAGALKLYDSYHCSRYNTNTRVLTPDMFRSVFAEMTRGPGVIRRYLTGFSFSHASTSPAFRSGGNTG